MTASIALISNTKSGRNIRKGLDDVHSVAKEQSIPIYEVDSYASLEKALKVIAKNTPDVLVINGGDGSVDAAISIMRNQKIFKKEPALALLQSGTTNMTHKDLGLKGKPASAFKWLLQHVKEGVSDKHIVEREPLKISDGVNTRYGFFFGANAMPRMILLARDQMHTKGLTGPTGQVLMFMKMLGRFILGDVKDDVVLHPDDIEMNGKKVASVLLIATTLNQLLLSLKPVPEGTGVGIAQVQYPYKGIMGSVCKLLTSKEPISQNGVESKRMEKLSLSLKGSWTLDGELYDAEQGKPLVITTGKPLRFVRV